MSKASQRDGRKRGMRTLVFLPITACILLVGCLPNPVSVSRDGTIALTLSEEGEYELIQGEGRQVYLTNATADFLTRIEGMEECRFPAISPSGRFIAACSDDRLVLYDRETKKRRIIDRSRMEDGTLDFPTWSPDERRIAFFDGDYEGHFLLKVCDVRRRELEVLDRQAFPRATWLPDGKRLLYISLPRVDWESGAAPIGDLKMMNAKTGARKTLAPGQLLGFSQVAAYPDGQSILFPFLSWEDAELPPEGLTVPIALKRERLASKRQSVSDPASEKSPGQEISQPEQATSEPGVEDKQPAKRGEETPPEEFTLSDGEPFYPMACAVSPDGKKIAYVRYIWTQPASSANETQHENEESAEDEIAESERGLEFCVANADGTGGLVIARGERDENAQVLWLGNTRLLCITEDTIVAVDADGKNPFDLTEAIRTKFADQFSLPENKVEPGGGSSRSQDAFL
jgi:hypothetical protein